MLIILFERSNSFKNLAVYSKVQRTLKGLSRSFETILRMDCLNLRKKRQLSFERLWIFPPKKNNPQKQHDAKQCFMLRYLYITKFRKEIRGLITTAWEGYSKRCKRFRYQQTEGKRKMKGELAIWDTRFALRNWFHFSQLCICLS